MLWGKARKPQKSNTLTVACTGICFLLVLSLSLFMQDAVLEPYGGQVFGMAITETTQLNAFFGIG